MRRLIWLLPLVVVFALGFRTNGYRSDVEVYGDYTFQDSTTMDKLVVQGAAAFEDTVDVNDARFTQIQCYRKTPSALVTFVFDDGDTSVASGVKDEFDAQGEVGCAAIIPGIVGNAGVVSWAQVQGLYADGWEILNHANTGNIIMDTCTTDSMVRYQWFTADTAFTNHGITVRNAAYPGYANNSYVRRVTAEFYRSARAGGLTYNTYPVLTYQLRSLAIDNHVNLANYKAKVDTIETKGLWQIFVMHAANPEDVDTLGLLIDYIQAKNIPIVTIDQALDSIGNRFVSGDFNVSADGKFDGAKVRIYWQDTNKTTTINPALYIQMDTTLQSPANTYATGIYFSGNAFNTTTDYWLLCGTGNAWSADGHLQVSKLSLATYNQLNFAADIASYITSAYNRDLTFRWDATKKGDIIFKDGNHATGTANINFIQVQDSSGTANLNIPNRGIRGTATFTAAMQTDTVAAVAGVTANSFIFIQVKGTTVPTAPFTWSYLATDSFLVHCAEADTAIARASGYNWLRLE